MNIQSTVVAHGHYVILEAVDSADKIQKQAHCCCDQHFGDGELGRPVLEHHDSALDPTLRNTMHRGKHCSMEREGDWRQFEKKGCDFPTFIAITDYLCA